MPINRQLNNPPKLPENSTELNANSTELNENGIELSQSLKDEIETLGKKPRKQTTMRLIIKLCEQRTLNLEELKNALNRESVQPLRRLVSELEQQSYLARRYSDKPTHPQQAYFATEQGLAWLATQETTE